MASGKWRLASEFECKPEDSSGAKDPFLLMTNGGAEAPTPGAVTACVDEGKSEREDWKWIEEESEPEPVGKGWRCKGVPAESEVERKR